MAVQAVNHLTSQQVADLALQYWQSLRQLPRREREAKLDELLKDLKGENQHG